MNETLSEVVRTLGIPYVLDDDIVLYIDRGYFSDVPNVSVSIKEGAQDALNNRNPDPKVGVERASEPVKSRKLPTKDANSRIVDLTPNSL